MTHDRCIRLSPPWVSCHSSSFCELPDGDLLACCFASPDALEGGPNQVVLGARFDRRAGRWSDPQVWVDVPGHAAGNPRLFVPPAAGEVWLVVPLTYGVWCSGGSLLFLKRSYDGGRTWKDLEMLCERKGVLGKNKPFIRGSLIVLPVEHEQTWSAAFLRSEDGGKNWSLHGDLGRDSGRRVIQPTVVERSDGALVAYMRTQENYIYESASHDLGRTWSRVVPTRLPNNNSGIDMVRLRSGNWALAFNPTHLDKDPKSRDPGLPEGVMVGFLTWGPRTPLVVSLSADQGKSWPHTLILEDAPGHFSYPVIRELSDGSIHVTYTHQRTSIGHVAFGEEELLAAPAYSEDGAVAAWAAPASAAPE